MPGVALARAIHPPFDEKYLRAKRPERKLMWVLLILQICQTFEAHIAFASMHLAPGPKFLVMTIDNTGLRMWSLCPKYRAPAIDSLCSCALSTVVHITGTRQAGLGTFIQIIVKLLPPEDFTKFLPICSSPVKVLWTEQLWSVVPNLGVILVNLFLPRVSLLNYKYGSWSQH